MNYVVARMYALWTSVKKADKVFERMGASQLSKGAASRISMVLDAGVAELHPCHSYCPYDSPYLWIYEP